MSLWKVDLKLGLGACRELWMDLLPLKKTSIPVILLLAMKIAVFKFDFTSLDFRGNLRTPKPING